MDSEKKAQGAECKKCMQYDRSIDSHVWILVVWSEYRFSNFHHGAIANNNLRGVRSARNFLLNSKIKKERLRNRAREEPQTESTELTVLKLNI